MTFGCVSYHCDPLYIQWPLQTHNDLSRNTITSIDRHTKTITCFLHLSSEICSSLTLRLLLSSLFCSLSCESSRFMENITSASWAKVTWPVIRHCHVADDSWQQVLGSRWSGQSYTGCSLPKYPVKQYGVREFNKWSALANFDCVTAVRVSVIHELILNFCGERPLRFSRVHIWNKTRLEAGKKLYQKSVLSL